MLGLDLTTISLRAKLASAANTTQPVWHVWYRVVPLAKKEGFEEYPLAVKRTVMSDTSYVTICEAPRDPNERVHIESATCVNRSADEEIVQVETYDGSNGYPVIIKTLAANGFVGYEDEHGWYPFDESSGGTTVVEFNNDFILPGPGELNDGESRGIKVPGELGETVAFGEVMYLKAADGQWYKADASTTATSGSKIHGVCLIAGADNASTQVLLYGMVRADSLYPTFNKGDEIYLSLTAGAVFQGDPATDLDGTGEVTKVLGGGWDANTMFFNPSGDHRTHV